MRTQNVGVLGEGFMTGSFECMCVFVMPVAAASEALAFGCIVPGGVPAKAWPQLFEERVNA